MYECVFVALLSEIGMFRWEMHSGSRENIVTSKNFGYLAKSSVLTTLKLQRRWDAALILLYIQSMLQVGHINQRSLWDWLHVLEDYRESQTPVAQVFR